MPKLRPDGTKLLESAASLRVVRKSLLEWVRDTCATSDNLALCLDDVEDIIGAVNKIENLRMFLEAKASVLGAAK